MKVKAIAIGSAVLIAAGLVGGLFLGKKKEGNSNINEVEKEIDESNLSFPESKYTVMATMLREAMDRIGTDEDTIYGVLALLKTKDDWFKLYLKFGNYLPSIFSWNAGQLSKGDLIEWLIEELDSSEIAKVRTILSKIGVMI